MTGNEAIAEAAIQAGCRHFFGYPITPQNEIPEYMSRRMPEVGGDVLLPRVRPIVDHCGFIPISVPELRGAPGPAAIVKTE